MTSDLYDLQLLKECSEKLLQKRKKLNISKRVFNNQVVSDYDTGVQYKITMDLLGCFSSQDKPYDTAKSFYHNFKGMFDYAHELDFDCQDEENMQISEELINYCENNDSIREYICSCICSPTEEKIKRFISYTVDMYIFLAKNGFLNVLQMEKEISQNEEELLHLSSGFISVYDSVKDEIGYFGDVRKGLINKTPKKLVLFVNKVIKIANHE